LNNNNITIEYPETWKVWQTFQVFDMRPGYFPYHFSKTFILLPPTGFIVALYTRRVFKNLPDVTQNHHH